MELTNIGKVTIAAAGPGDPDLITVKAALCLQQADVVLTDRLVSPELLKMYVKPTAEIIHVGKQCGRGYSTPQEFINELMVEYALKGKYVVRLKGGDVSVFSNILDELECLVANKISYEIIPGVTAAAGAAAYAGIPLTARNYATAVRFITHHKNEALTPQYWRELTSTNDTLVFYMSSATLFDLAWNLLANGAKMDLPVAIIEQATTPFQNVEVYTLGEIGRIKEQKNFVSPTLVIIGKVAGLHKKFSWLVNSQSKASYFHPLEELIDTIRKSA